MKKQISIGIVAVIVLIGVGYLVLHRQQNSTNRSATNQSTQRSSSTSETSITFDGNQFNPASLTVKSGSSITIKNTSSSDLQMDSNPHPIHTDDTDLNVGLVAAGSSKTFTVTKTGTYGYHDHLDPSIQGKITIQ